MKERIAIMLLSCDRYYDMIEPFAELMNRNWPDCPFDKFCATNNMPFSQYGFKPILLGEDKSWSAGLKKGLIQLKNQGYEYVFITLEDLFIVSKVDTSRVITIVSDFIRLNGNYIRFYNHFKPSKKCTDDFGELEKGIPYRQNCVYALWKIDTLLAILKDDENAWEFEKIAVCRGYDYDGFYAVYKSQFKILNTLIKGKWVPSDFKKAKKFLPNLKTSRQIMSYGEELKLNLKRGAFHVFFWLVPEKFQKKFI